ncbi:MAG: DUF4331 domain-containing protein [Burkholderiales bacterium]|nr:DUF4331 domain-containing protein [Burkholderiales bacterium]
MKLHSSLQPQTAIAAAAALVAIAAGLAAAPAHASSHREAPAITGMPKVDGADFYMFNSYEPGRSGYVTLIADYLPLQDAYGGPNYFKLDPRALYEIHVDNNGDGAEDLTFQFRFQNLSKGQTLPIGGANVAIPLTQFGPVTDASGATLNVTEGYTLSVVRGDRRGGSAAAVTHGGSAMFGKPVDYIGTKTIPNYPAYAAQFVYTIDIPGCAGQGRVFVGQRKDPFAVNLGVIFDLVNVPSAAFLLNNANRDAGTDSLADKNVTALALEVPTSCLLANGGADPVIGAWTTASVRQGKLMNGKPPSGHDSAELDGGAWTQVSRLGMPLVNEVVIGLNDKDRFNASKPRDDAQFATYVTNPTLPKLLEIALAAPGISPTNYPRTDLVTTFLTGIPGVNQPAHVKAAEMLRLNTAIPATPYASQNRLGLLGGLLGPAPKDLAGYPNGRRPNDDVVDISLVAVMGGLCVANGNANTYGFGAACNPAAVPLGAAVFGLHDGVDQAGPKVRAQGPLLPGFPYIGTPLPGAQ